MCPQVTARVAWEHNEHLANRDYIVVQPTVEKGTFGVPFFTTEARARDKQLGRWTAHLSGDKTQDEQEDHCSNEGRNNLANETKLGIGKQEV